MAHLPAAPAKNPPSRWLLTLAFIGFISLGLPDAVIGVAWPSVREEFSLHQGDLGAILLVVGCGYFASSFLAGQLTRHLGLGALLAVSSGFVALSQLGSAAAPVWILLVASGVLAGLGSGGIDAGLNAYVSSNFSARHVNWLHACYSLGATLGPLWMGAAVTDLHSWRTGYAGIGAVMLTMSIGFAMTRRAWGKAPAELTGEPDPTQPAAADIGVRATLTHPLVRLQVLVFFLYTGLEFTVGQWAYTLLTESRGVSREVADLWVSAYYGSIGVGRVLFGVVADRIDLDRLVRLALLAAVAGAGLLCIPSPTTSFLGLILVGVSLAPVYPCLMSRTPDRLGNRYATHAIGFQVSAAMLGGALAPSIAGLLIAPLGLDVVAWTGAALAVILWAMHELLVRRGAPYKMPPR